jgi:hypothetical protein
MTMDPPDLLVRPDQDHEAQQASLDDLLCRWHSWQQAAVLTRGMNRKALVVGDYQAQGGYRIDDDVIDARSEHLTMKAVDFQVDQMVNPYRIAMYVMARAISLGVVVFCSPRLPPDRTERQVVCLEARRQAIDRFTRAGIM